MNLPILGMMKSASMKITMTFNVCIILLYYALLMILF
jgi:hypothetical protein